MTRSFQNPRAISIEPSLRDEASTTEAGDLLAASTPGELRKFDGNLSPLRSKLSLMFRFFNRPGLLRKTIGLFVLLPLMAWSSSPAIGDSFDDCKPIKKVAHACCRTGSHGMPDMERAPHPMHMHSMPMTPASPCSCSGDRPASPHRQSTPGAESESLPLPKIQKSASAAVIPFLGNSYEFILLNLSTQFADRSPPGDGPRYLVFHSLLI